MEFSRSTLKVLGVWSLLAALSYQFFAMYPGERAAEQETVQLQLRGIRYQKSLLKAYYFLTEHRRLSEMGPILDEAQAAELNSLRPALEASLDEVVFLIKKSLPHDRDESIDEKVQKEAIANVDEIQRDWKNLRRETARLKDAEIAARHKRIGDRLRVEIQRTNHIFQLDKESDPNSWSSVQTITRTFPEASERLADLATLVQRVNRQGIPEEALKAQIMDQSAVLEHMKDGQLSEAEKSLTALAREARKLGSGDADFNLEYFQRKVLVSQRRLQVLHANSIQNLSLQLQSRISNSLFN